MLLSKFLFKYITMSVRKIMYNVWPRRHTTKACVLGHHLPNNNNVILTFVRCVSIASTISGAFWMFSSANIVSTFINGLLLNVKSAKLDVYSALISSLDILHRRARSSQSSRRPFKSVHNAPPSTTWNWSNF